MHHWKKFIRMIGYHRSKNLSYLSRTCCGNVGISHRLNEVVYMSRIAAYKTVDANYSIPYLRRIFFQGQ